VGSIGAPDELLGALRALTALEFEQLAGQLPPRWTGLLRSQGIDIGGTGFGVIFKARWQSVSRPVRAELAQALGTAVARMAGHLTVGPRLQAVAVVVAARSGQLSAGAPPSLAPGIAADLLSAAGATAGQAVAAAASALEAGLPCAEEIVVAVGEYNEALAAARQAVADHGVEPVPDGCEALLAALRKLAANADREPVRTAVASFTETESDLPVVRSGRRQAMALLAAAPADWDQRQLGLAEGLAAIMELCRLVAAGAGPTDLLAMSARANSTLPSELHGLVVLAASGSLPATRSHRPVTSAASVAVA